MILQAWNVLHLISSCSPLLSLLKGTKGGERQWYSQRICLFQVLHMDYLNKSSKHPLVVGGIVSILMIRKLRLRETENESWNPAESHLTRKRQRQPRARSPASEPTLTYLTTKRSGAHTCTHAYTQLFETIQEFDWRGLISLHNLSMVASSCNSQESCEVLPLSLFHKWSKQRP